MSDKLNTTPGRNGKEYNLWRDSVIERDDYRCRICRERKGIEAHHMMTWKDHPEKRFEIANGITLCAECHKSAHRYKRLAE